MLVTLNGTTMSGARVPFAAARDGYFFPALAEVHPRFLTPPSRSWCKLVLAIPLFCWAANFVSCFRWRFSRNGCFT